MSKKILITHTLMVKEHHEQQLREAGFEIIRLKDLEATEDQLCAVVPDIDGYILGGLEKITNRVIDSAPKLRAICTTAASWKTFIPAHKYATERGIAIVSAQGANSQSVAEYTIALIHDRVKNVSYLSGEGQGGSFTARNFRGLKLGLIGVGKVGNKVGRILNAAYGMKILYTSIHQDLDFEFATGATWLELDDLLSRSDIISIHVPADKELHNLINKNNVSFIKDGAILINMSFKDVIDQKVLIHELESGRISVATDVGYNPDFAHISSKNFIQFTSFVGYKTQDTAEIASDVVTLSIVNLLNNNYDSWVVNPEYREYISD